MNVKIIYYCYIIYLIFHFVLLSCDILTRYQISQTLKNILTLYKKQDKKSSNEELVNFSSTVTLISKTLTRMGNAYDYCIGSQNYRVAIHVISKGQTTLSEAGCASFPWLTGLLLWFMVVVVFIVEEPVSMRVGWTNIYTLSVEGMKPAICPVWSATT